MADQDRYGRWMLVNVLARGGAGAVWRARDEAGQEVALKLPLGSETLSEHQRQRFLREAMALVRLRHPNVVRAIDAGESAGVPWIALELVEGESLDTRLRREGRLPIVLAEEIVEKLARAVAHAHAMGVVHRDLKPSNVLLRRNGEPVLTDFGLTCDVDRELAPALTVKGRLMGTPGYWAPEQVEGDPEETGPATDVHGLGALLFALVTGRPPHGDPASIPEAILALEETVPPPSSLRAEVDPGLDLLCRACLERDPAARLAGGAQEVADTLARRRRRREGRPWSHLLLIGAAAAAAAGLPVLAWSLASPTTARPAPGTSSDEPRPEAPATDARRGAAELSEIEGLSAEDERCDRLEAWLAANPGHPQAERAAALQRQLLARVPWRVIAHEDATHAVWLGRGDLLTCGGTRVRRWDVPRRELRETWDLPERIGGMDVLGGEPPGALVGLVDGRLFAWRAGRELAPRGRLELDGPSLSGLWVAPGGGHAVAIARERGWMFELDAAGTPGPAVILQHERGVRVAAFSPDGSRVYTSAGDVRQIDSALAPELRAWRAPGGEPAWATPPVLLAHGLAVSPDDQLLAVGGQAGRLLLFDLASSEHAFETLGGSRTAYGQASAHSLTSRVLAFTPDGKRLVSTAGEPTEGRGGSELAVWDVASGRELAHLDHRPGGPRCLRIDPDGRWAALCLSSGRIEVWDLHALCE